MCDKCEDAGYERCVCGHAERSRAEKQLMAAEREESRTQHVWMLRQDADSWRAYKNAQDNTDRARARITELAGW